MRTGKGPDREELRNSGKLNVSAMKRRRMRMRKISQQGKRDKGKNLNHG